MQMYKKIPLNKGLYLHLRLDTPIYKLKTPQEIKEINKTLNTYERVLTKRNEYLKERHLKDKDRQTRIGRL